MVKRKHVQSPGTPYTVGGGSVSGGSRAAVSRTDMTYLFDARSIAQDSGTAVTSWAPAVGVEALAQGTGAYQPTLTKVSASGLASVDFDGSNFLGVATSKLGFVGSAGPAVSGISAADPGVVTTSSAHGLATGDVIALASVGGLVMLNGMAFEVTVTGATTFTIPFNTSSPPMPAYTSGGTVDPVWKQTCIIVWASAVTPTPSTSYNRGLWGWSADTTAENIHSGFGATQTLVGTDESYWLMYGDASSTLIWRGDSATNTATNVHVLSATSNGVFALTGPVCTEAYTGAPTPSTLTLSLHGGLPAPPPANFRASQAMSAGCFAYKNDTLRCLDGQLKAVYVWNRVLTSADLSRAMKRIAGTWLG